MLDPVFERVICLGIVEVFPCVIVPQLIVCGVTCRFMDAVIVPVL